MWRHGKMWTRWMWTALLFVGSCAGEPVRPAEKPAATATFQPPRMEYRGIRYEQASFDGMDLLFRFEILSQDARVARVLTCPHKFTLAGQPTLEGSTAGGELAPHGTLMVETRIAVPWPKTTAELREFLAKREHAYQFEQRCNVEGPEGGLVLSGADSGALLVPRLPKLEVSGANTERTGDGRFRFNFELSVTNENTSDLQIGVINYKINVEGIDVAEGRLPIAESIPPSTEASYDIATPRFSASERKEMKSFLSKSSLSYRLQGSVSSGNMEIPVDSSGKIHFAR